MSNQYLQIGTLYNFNPGDTSTLYTDAQGPYTYLWVFGDGQPDYLSDGRVQHRYGSIVGPSVVSCTVTDITNSLSLTSQANVVIADFTITVTINTPSEGQLIQNSVQYLGQGVSNYDGSNLSYLWTFDDDTTSTQQDPVKTWSTIGPHSAVLLVTDTVSGYMNESTVDFTVGDPVKSWIYGGNLGSTTPGDLHIVDSGIFVGLSNTDIMVALFASDIEVFAGADTFEKIAGLFQMWSATGVPATCTYDSENNRFVLETNDTINHVKFSEFAYNQGADTSATIYKLTAATGAYMA